MGTTELEDVQALVDRVRPDPTGFAQRLLVQVMARWGNDAQPDVMTFYRDDMPEEPPTVITPSDPPPDDEPVDTNLLLAGALGACHCWGLRAGCEVCGGAGSPGWIQPDPELFKELVGPAVMKMSTRSSGGGPVAAENTAAAENTQGVDR
jgi:hypothetical protein